VLFTFGHVKTSRTQLHFISAVYGNSEIRQECMICQTCTISSRKRKTMLWN